MMSWGDSQSIPIQIYLIWSLTATLTASGEPIMSSFVCGLYVIVEVPYRDRRLGKPLAGLCRPIRGPLGSCCMGLEEFYTGQRQKTVWFE